MELRDYSNLKTQFNVLTQKNKDLVYRGATTNGLLEVRLAPSAGVLVTRGVYDLRERDGARASQDFKISRYIYSSMRGQIYRCCSILLAKFENRL